MHQVLLFIVFISNVYGKAVLLLTMYKSENDLRGLIGSAHQAIGTDIDLFVKVFGMKSLVAPGFLDEITLWRRVDFIDIRTEILFEPHKNSKPQHEESNTEFLKLSIIEHIFENYNINHKNDQVIFIESGFEFVKILLELRSGRGVGYEIFDHECLNHELSRMRSLPVKENICKSEEHELKLPLLQNDSKLHCSIQIRQELTFSKMIKVKNEPSSQDQNTGKRVALLVPAKTPIDFKGNLDHIPLVKSLLTSMKLIDDSEDFNIKIFVGHDFDDILSEKSNQEAIKMHAPKGISIAFIEFPRTNWVTFIWNALYALAHHEGYEYFFQLNDDIVFLETNWLSSSISMLTSEETGVIGMEDVTWQCNLFTQTMVNRQHYRHFRGMYFPLTLKNWYSDDWITKVYGRDAKCNDRAKIINGHETKTRYSPCDSRNYEKALQDGFKQLNY